MTVSSKVRPPEAPANKNRPPRRRNLVNAKYVSELLDIPMTTLYDNARAGNIPGVIRIGTRVRFDLDILNEWLDAGGDKK